MKNRVLRSALAVILVIAMVLTMAACNNTDPVETTAPVVTTAPAATTAPTEAPVVTVAPTEAPAEEVVDTDEAQLNTYGITFPEFDLEYVLYTSDDFDKDAMTFGLKVDTDNIYQEAYDFSISAKITAVALDGSSLSKSKFSLVSLYDTDSDGSIDLTGKNEDAAKDTYDISSNDGYFDAGSIGDWDNTSKYYFQVGAAGVYTVTYTIEVEHDKDYTYGYYQPGEVDEKYTITKTYTVEKAELNLKTSDDAFQVSSSMFFVDASYKNSDTFKAVADDYSVAIDVTSCTGTEVGEYPLTITITDDDDNVVDPSDIELANWYVTVTEGTRYILSKEDVAKANAVRKMYATDKSIDVTTEYSQETITYYNTLTDGQKVMAAVVATEWDDYEDDYVYTTLWSKYYNEYLVEETAVDDDAIEEAEYNMNRDYIVDEIEDAIDAYMTASTTAKKAAAKTSLAELILSIDNTAHEYGSDVLYALGALATGYIEDGAYVPFDTDDTDIEDDFYINDTITYVVLTEDQATDEFIITFVGDEDDDEYSISFEYDVNFYAVKNVDTKTKAVVNAKYDGYLSDWIDAYADYQEAVKAIDDAILAAGSKSVLDQGLVDDLTDAIDDMEDEYADLITYQLSLKPNTDKVSEEHSDALDYAESFVARWDAYIALIEAYGFEDSYIDNANKDDLAATFEAMYFLLGYNFENNDLSAVLIDMNVSGLPEMLSNVLFLSKSSAIYLDADDSKYVPDLFVDGVLATTEGMMQITLAVQTEVDAVKQDLINYLVSTGDYSLYYESTSDDDYEWGAYTDIESETTIATFIQMETWLDGYVSDQLTDSDSDFWKDYTKKGLDTAMTELFEDATEDCKDLIDAWTEE